MMEFDKTRWSCPLNSDQNCTKNSARVLGVKGIGIEGSKGGGLGMMGVYGVGD